MRAQGLEALARSGDPRRNALANRPSPGLEDLDRLDADDLTLVPRLRQALQEAITQIQGVPAHPENLRPVFWLAQRLAHQVRRGRDFETARASLLTAAEVLIGTDFEYLALCELAEVELASGDPRAAQSWLALCDPRPSSFELDCSYRRVSALLALSAGRASDAIALVEDRHGELQSVPHYAEDMALIRLAGYEERGETSESEQALVNLIMDYSVEQLTALSAKLHSQEALRGCWPPCARLKACGDLPSEFTIPAAYAVRRCKQRWRGSDRLTWKFGYEFPRRRRSLLPDLAGLAAIAAVELVSCGLAYLSASVLLAIFGSVVAMAGLFYLGHLVAQSERARDQRIMLVLSMASGLAAAGAGMADSYLLQLGALRGRQFAYDVPIVEAPLHNDAAGISFRDGAPATVFSTYYKRVRSSSRPGSTSKFTTYFWVAPLVPDGWVKRDPVPAWVACKNGCEDEWLKPYRAGLPVSATDPDNYDNYMIAVARAGKVHGIHAAPDAPLLEWVADPALEVKTKWRWAWFFIVLPYLVFLPMNVILRIRLDSSP